MIWILGCRGMLGTELSHSFGRAGLSWTGTDKEVSILDAGALEKYAREQRPDWIVNCAAYTAVDKAEDEPELCHALNATGPENLGRIAARAGARVLHLSTDYVFSGLATRPCREDDPTGPTGVYGRSKADGEAALRAVAPDSVILRTAWLYGLHGPNFVYTMLRLMKERTQIGVVADQRGTPTWTKDLAEAILTIVTSQKAEPGIFHFTCLGDTTWHEFATVIRDEALRRELLNHECDIRALTTAEYPTRARRPAYSVLSKEKIERCYGIRPKEWKLSLGAFLDELAAQPAH